MGKKFDIHSRFWKFGGDGGFDPAAAADGYWDPELQITYSGPDPVSMADQSGNGRDLTYRYALGSATADTFNGREVVRFPGATPGNCSFYSDEAGALVGAGTDVAWTLAGCFMLDVVGVTQVFMSMDSSAASADYHRLAVNSSNVLSLYSNSQTGADQYLILSATLEALVPYSYVLRVNGDGTVGFWLNGVPVDSAAPYGGTLFPSMTRLAISVLDLTNSAPAYPVDGILGPHRFDARAISDGEADDLATYLHGIWSA